MAPKGAKALSPARREDLLATLRDRFEQHMHRHQALRWDEVRARLEAHPHGLWSLNEMEESGGEPDVLGRNAATDGALFGDRRFGRVWFHYNGAQSHYAARGFRCLLRVWRRLSPVASDAELGQVMIEVLVEQVAPLGPGQRAERE